MPLPDSVRRAADSLRMVDAPARPTAVSRHLSKLRLARPLIGRREGNRVIHTVTDQPLAELPAHVFAQEVNA